GALLLTLLAPPTASLAAQKAPYCPNTDPPGTGAAFTSLKQALGTTMGNPVDCQHQDPKTGETVQTTSTGLAYLDSKDGYPSFTTGAQHWALAKSGVVTWTGD